MHFSQCIGVSKFSFLKMASLTTNAKFSDLYDLKEELGK